MDIQEFIEKFVEACDDLEGVQVTPETKFRELDQWSSLCALSLIAMVDEEFDQELSAQELRSVETVEDLYNLVQSKL